MLIDARTLEDGALRTQVCIVGGGAAGITIAQDLIGTGTEVVLLESGGLEPDPPTQALYEGALVGEPFNGAGNQIQLDECRLRYLGGTTNHWTGYCRPLDDLDFEPRPYLGLAGWPFPRSELDRWYERAVDVVRLASTHFDQPWWQENHGLGDPLLTTELVDAPVFQVHLGFAFGTAYRAALEQATNVRVVIWANATRIGLSPDGSQVDRIDVQTLSGVRLTVEADIYVVALGGIETPRLLLASNDIRPTGVGNGRDLVGRHFAEHLRAQTGFVVLEPAVPDLSFYASTEIPAPHPDDPDNKIAAQGALTLSRTAATENELLGLEVQLTMVEDIAPMGERSVDGLRIDDVGPLCTAVDGSATTTMAYVQVLGEQELNPASRVMLGTERDVLGMPKIELDWRHTELDRASIVAGLRIVGRELGRLGIGRLQAIPGGIGYMDDPEPEDFPFLESSAAAADALDFPLGVGFHHMSTTRMDDDPARGVVDANCRVHEVGNLYVAGSSVFATAATATPTFTITALALRLAEHVRGQLP